MHQPKSSKLPNSFTLEELLESANQEGTSEELVPSNDITDHDVFTFIQALGILNGDKRIQKRLLYQLYRNWSTEPLTHKAFSLFFNMFFQYDSLYYFLNMDALEILRIPFKAIRKVKRDPRKNKNQKRHFEAFLSFYKLHPGTFFVEFGVLYYLYDKWTFNNYARSPLGSKAFFKMVDLYFERKRLVSSKVAFFGINEDIKSLLGQDELETAQKWARKHNGRKTKEYKQKIKRKDKRWDKEKKAQDNEISREVPSIKPEGESKE